MKTRLLQSTLAVCASLLLINGSWALDELDGTSVTCTQTNPYGNAYFGDTHVHTTFSVDAFTQGVDTTPDQAYRFAKGEQIGLHPFDEFGLPTRFAQLERPLDFTMLSDHAEFFGEYSICNDPGNPLYNNSNCQLLRQRDNAAFLGWNVLLGALRDNVTRFDFCGLGGSICTDEADDLWQQTQHAAELHYDRSSDCEFTTFIGYEYTGAPVTVGPFGLEALNYHRNIMFLNSVVPDKPSSYLDAPYAEDLWAELQADCLDIVDGSNECQVMTIPHNSNISQGLLLETTKSNGQPYGIGLAVQRFKFDRLLEIMQHKGQSECLPSSGDELCDFEIVPWGHLAGNFINPTEPRKEGFAREGLKVGIAKKAELKGVNIFKYGFVGGTDTHLGTPGLVDETVEYPGHGGAAEGSGPGAGSPGITDAPQFNPGGLTVVWATQNSRRALYDAMHRKEVYATSGPRHILRFYGSWQNDLPANICSLPNLAQLAFNDAVAMGGTLPATVPGDTTPQFLVSVLKDAGTLANPGNDLQRVQIIKGWTDSLGATHEKVFEVAGDPLNGASVDVNSCAVSGSGFASLCELWQDPEFDPTQDAFYYARVIENPSCRWSQKQCLASPDPIDCGLPGSIPTGFESCCDVEIPKTIQERSWSSPIWFDPALYMPPGC